MPIPMPRHCLSRSSAASIEGGHSHANYKNGEHYSLRSKSGSVKGVLQTKIIEVIHFR